MIKKKPRTDEAPTEAPAAPERVQLTNKAGAGATPLAQDVEAWLNIGWYRV
jgi:hypothetical protein